MGKIENEKINLNNYGKIVRQQWLEKKYSYIQLDEYIIIPNHIHAILIINNVGNGRAHSLLKQNPYDNKMKKQQLKSIFMHSIGIIHSPNKNSNKTPIQPVYAKGIKGDVEVFAQYTEGLRDLEAFSHIYLIYYFHKAGFEKLSVKPFLEDIYHGVFATRAPSRPNRIGISIVKLIKVEDNIIHVEDVDILDQTPLLDIKPFVSRFDFRDNVRCGWQDNIDEKRAQILGSRKKM